MTAIPEEKKEESRHRPRISFYGWLRQQGDEERRVTFKTEEKVEGEVTKEGKEGIENVVQNYLQPKISSKETKEYERYPPQTPSRFPCGLALLK